MDQNKLIPTAYATPISPTMVLPLPTEYCNDTNHLLSYDPPKLHDSPRQIEEEQLEQLKNQGYTTGLGRALFNNVSAFPLRIWIIDNSGSMATCDGKRFVETNDRRDVRTVTCTRWNELQDTVEYHARMAGLLRAPTAFRMLNDPGLGAGSQQFSICQRGDEMIEQDIQRARDIMRRSTPRGTTPLTGHIIDIRNEILSMKTSLANGGKKVAIIIATDGLPTDEYGSGGEWEKRNFVNAIKSLEGLPVWVVVRLCTDDDSVAEFYNELDSQLEISVEVLDDFVSEAKEVRGQNRWVNYTLPLHRCREMGYNHRLFDLLDERKLTRTELREFCQLLFGDDLFDGVPDPEGDWNGFLTSVKTMLEKESPQYNPITRGMGPVIAVDKLNRDYGSGGCGCAFFDSIIDLFRGI